MPKWKCLNCEFITEDVEKLRIHTALHSILINENPKGDKEKVE